MKIFSEPSTADRQAKSGHTRSLYRRASLALLKLLKRCGGSLDAMLLILLCATSRWTLFVMYEAMTSWAKSSECFNLLGMKLSTAATLPKSKESKIHAEPCLSFAVATAMTSVWPWLLFLVLSVISPGLSFAVTLAVIFLTSTLKCGAGETGCHSTLQTSPPIPDGKQEA